MLGSMLNALPLALALVMALPLVACACGHDGTTNAQGAEVASYETRGTVERVEKERQSVTIEHEDVPGYMPAMTMPFSYEDTSLVEGLAPGDRVAFTFEARSGGRHVIVALRKL